MSELRVRIQNEPEAVRFELEGRLGGADVEAVHEVWQREAFVDARTSVIVDITFISEADHYGRALLVLMHRFGAQIVAKTPESYAIVRRIVEETLESPVSKPGWLDRFIGFFLNHRNIPAFLPRAEMISLIPGRYRRLGSLRYAGPCGS